MAKAKVKNTVKIKKTPAATLPWDIQPPNREYSKGVKALLRDKNE